MEPPLSQKEYIALTNPAPTKTYSEYKNIMSCTVGAVMNSLDSASFKACLNKESVYEIMESLLKIHHKTDKLSKINYLSKMLSTPMEDPSNPAEHFKTWKKLVTEAANHGVNDQDLKISEVISMLCLRSIHPDFNTVVTVIESNSSKKTESIEEIEGQILAR